MRILTLLLALLLATPVAEARPAAGRDRVAQNDRKDRLKKRIRTMRAIVLVEELDLDEATAAKLMPILNKYDDQFAKLAKENADLRKEADDLAAKGDDKAIDKVVDKLVANQRARWDLDEARFKEVRKVLTAKQAARILVVLPDIDRRILQGAQKAIRGGKGNKARGNGETR